MKWFPKIALVLGCGVVGAFLSLHFNPSVAAQEPTPGADAAPVQQSATAGQPCADCHLDVLRDWQGSVHANAYHDPLFQEAWAALDSDTECLACHTTGYQPFTGTYMTEGVSCEACHGPTPADHPTVPVAIDPGVTVCTDCHVTTFQEWQRSAHGDANVDCTACHLPHPQQIRYDDANLLCADCHDTTALVGFAHEAHPEQTCVDCHWHRSQPDLGDHILTGNLMYTGHDSHVETAACTDCHADRDAAFLTEVQEIAQESSLLEANLRISELEAEQRNVEAQGENEQALQLIQGLLAGMLVGTVITVGVGVVRRRV
ncbi:MAG: hypothetical protein HC915_07495 [Anaerolineae bacterium]|nr:hypothetical protein [Anaerolineae bacterium]